MCVCGPFVMDVCRGSGGLGMDCENGGCEDGV